GAIESRVVAHLDDGRDSTPLLADDLGMGIGELGLARGVGAIAELVLEPLEMDRVALAIRGPAGHEKATRATARLREHQEGVAHRRRHDPLAAARAVGTRAPAWIRLSTRRVGAQIRPALALRHRHADQRRVFLAAWAAPRIVRTGENARQPFGREC